MSMESFLFYVCGAVFLGGGVAMVTSRSAVAAACWLILAFLGAAGLFAALAAPFLAVLQVLIYAGAIMVLFLFVIMMLQRPGPGGRAGAAQGLAAHRRHAARGGLAGDRPDLAAPRGSAGLQRAGGRRATARWRRCRGSCSGTTCSRSS